MPNNQILESSTDFQKWYDNFVQLYGGLKVDSSWFESVQANHQDIRNFIGGLEVSDNITIKGGYNINQSKVYVMDDWIRSMSSCIVNFYAYIPDKKKLYHPLITVDGKQISTAKYIMSLVQQHPAYLKTNAVADAQYYIDGLSAEWNRNTIEASTFDITLSTLAKDFAKLGHYGPDYGSCFSQAHDNEHHKYNLGSCDDTFVLTIGKANTVYGRAWGFATNNFDTFNVCNLYCNQKQAKTPTFTKCLESFFANLINKPTLTYFNRVDFSNPNNVYLNNQTYTFTSLSSSPVTTLDTESDWSSTHSEQMYECPHCDERWYDDEDFTEIDGEMCCPDCFDDACYCDLCGGYTFSAVYEFRNQGRLRFGCKGCLEEDGYKKCKDCGIFFKELTDGLCKECQPVDTAA